MLKNNKNGFSLIELLIVVAIILIIAAIAIPSLVRARIAANESSAVASVRTIKTAEMTYYNAYPDVGYATQLTDLGGAKPCTPSTTAACVLDDPLSTAGPSTNGKSGYVFVAIGSTSAGSNHDQYVVGSAPVNSGITGVRLFCTTSDNSIRSDPGPGTTPITTISACINYSPL